MRYPRPIINPLDAKLDFPSTNPSLARDQQHVDHQKHIFNNGYVKAELPQN